MTLVPEPRERRALEGREIALVDLLDRVLSGGVVLTGEVTLCIADIELVRISLRALVGSVHAGVRTRDPALPPVLPAGPAGADPDVPGEPRP